MTKIKVAWICTYADEEKLRHLRRWRNSVVNYGSWIPDFLRGFAGDARFEIHVISTQSWLKHRFTHWDENGIHYHCVQFGVPFFGCPFPAFLPCEEWTKYWLNTRRIQRVVRDINPDLIHLFGAENANYASSILKLKDDYPILLTLQGFLHREKEFHPKSYRFDVACRQESRVLSACKWFTGEYESETVARRFAAVVRYFPMYFPINEGLVKELENVRFEKKYDLLFLSRICKQKGIDDYFEIVRLLKQRMPMLRAAVVGRGMDVSALREKAELMGVGENIIPLGFLPTQRQAYEVFKASRVFLVPTYNDCFATTIRESMMLGTPVVAYRTGGIPFANRNGRNNIQLVEQGDLEGMAESVYALFENPRMAGDQIVNARAFAQSEFSLAHNVDVIRLAYQVILGR